jgi:cation:H+ antiporter
MLLTTAFMLLGLLLLTAGAEGLVRGAASLARRLGLSPLVIGLTVVAFGTSTPELVVSLQAALGGNSAIGNVVGSNIFNILGILGVTALIQPLSGSGLSLVDLAVMVGLTVLMLPVMRTQYTLSRAEGAALLAIYGSYLAYLLW